MANVLHSDQCTAIRRSWDISSPVKVELSIGTDDQEKDPVAKAMHALAGIWNLFGMFAGSNQLF
jgi:hypothetical protein